MKRSSSLLLLTLFFTGCIQTTPTQYFYQAALNCNMFSRFGSYELKEQLAQQPLVFDKDSKKMVPAKSYKQAVELNMIERIEQNEQKVKDLKVTDDTKPMISSSLDLYTFVLDKYRTDYTRIADMKDANASQEDIDKAMADFDEKNIPVFTDKYKTFLDIAMVYAKKNNIDVKTY